MSHKKIFKWLGVTVFVVLTLTLLTASARAGAFPPELEEGTELVDEQLDALGRNDLMGFVPREARQYLEGVELYDLRLETLMQLTPGRFFPALWQMFTSALVRPLRTLAAMLAIILLCALLETLRTAAWENTLSSVFQTVSVLCILTFIAHPILDLIMDTTNTIREAATFMIGFIPLFTAALVSAGQPVTGATYSLFLMGACQLVAQVVAQTLIPLMSIYLALCICGAFVPDLNIVQAAGGIKTAVSWALGLLLTIFVALLSIQTMLSSGADGVSVRATKFLIGNLVPMVGSVLSDGYMAAQGYLRLLKTTVGVYGIVVAMFILLPTLIRVTIWYLLTRLVAMVGEIAGAGKVSIILRSCSNVLGVLISAILCFALLFIVSTGIIMSTGMGI